MSRELILADCESTEAKYKQWDIKDGKSGAICKTIFSPKLCVMLKILSSEYQSYACGKISRMP
jgi:hypothetical protein